MSKQTSSEVAFLFLNNSNRRPEVFDDIDLRDYILLLMEFEDIHGPEAIEGLAGAYIYAIDNKEGEEATRMINSVFAHDIGGRKSKMMLPRSSEYVKVWREECSKRGWTDTYVDHGVADLMKQMFPEFPPTPFPKTPPVEHDDTPSLADTFDHADPANR